MSVKAHHRKLRGGRRYFRRLLCWSGGIEVEFGPAYWYDFWRVHPDFQSWNTAGGRTRRAHLVALFQAFRRTVARVATYDGPRRCSSP
jgi:hypothetical protein